MRSRTRRGVFDGATHPTGVTPRGQAAVDAKPARPRLVDEHQLPARRLELAYRSPQRIHVATDLTVMANLAAFLRHREIDRFLVHIHTDVQLAPSKRGRCRPRSSQTPPCGIAAAGSSGTTQRANPGMSDPGRSEERRVGKECGAWGA